MCARECLAGERCDREAACRAADAKYGPLIKARQIELAEDKLLELQIECRDCADRHLGLAECNECNVPAQIARLEKRLVRMRTQAVGREERKPARDRRQAKPNAVFAKGVTR